jgi:hypothetical protein
MTTGKIIGLIVLVFGGYWVYTQWQNYQAQQATAGNSNTSFGSFLQDLGNSLGSQLSSGSSSGAAGSTTNPTGAASNTTTQNPGDITPSGSGSDSGDDGDLSGDSLTGLGSDDSSDDDV